MVVIAIADLATAQMIGKTVESVGGYSLIVHEAVQARATALVSSPAVLIVDPTMPRLDASSLVRALREGATARGAPVPAVIFLAAGPTDANELGADAVLEKPVDRRELEEILRRFLT